MIVKLFFMLYHLYQLYQLYQQNFYIFIEKIAFVPRAANSKKGDTFCYEFQKNDPSPPQNKRASGSCYIPPR